MGRGGGRPRINPRDYEHYRESIPPDTSAADSSNHSSGQGGGSSGGHWSWSNTGQNDYLSAGEKNNPSGNGVGTHWERTDGTSGQSQTHKAEDGTVSHWQHDRDGKGGETVSGVTYHPDGSTTFNSHTKR